MGRPGQGLQVDQFVVGDQIFINIWSFSLSEETPAELWFRMSPNRAAATCLLVARMKTNGMFDRWSSFVAQLVALGLHLLDGLDDVTKNFSLLLALEIQIIFLNY